MRRGLGRGRTLIAMGAIVAIIAMPLPGLHLLGIELPWLKVGGVVLSPETATGFDGSGVLVFLAAVLSLAIVVLPYTTRSRRSALDRPASYLALLLLALVGLVPAIVDLLDTEGAAKGPMDVPGLWLAASAVAIIAWGVAELFAERAQSA